MNRKTIMIAVFGGLIVLALIGGGAYVYVSSKSVYIDESVVSAPLINLSPVNSGILEAVFVKEGDHVVANQAVARVGDEIVQAKTAGQIVTVDQNIGQYENAFTGQATVATMISPTELRIVGHLDENKGLDRIVVGDPATFTVDTFGSREYQGVVDEIAPTAQSGSVVFDISSQRPTNQFDVYVRFDPAKYPELKNGMSARIWVYPK